ncbi:unnamed protein product [Caenorhabditis brenneri]
MMPTTPIPPTESRDCKQASLPKKNQKPPFKIEEDENGVSSTTPTAPRFFCSPMVATLIASKCEAQAKTS